MANFSDCSDEELIAACQQDIDAAWNVLVGRYERLVYTIPLRYGFGRSEADDVFQAVWITLLRHLHNLEQPDRLSAWLVTTAKRECWRRRRGTDFENSTILDPELLPEGNGSEEDPIEDILSRFEQHQLLNQMLRQLDVHCRRLLQALYYDADGRSYEEISQSLRIPVGAIGPTRARCLKKLRELLGAHL